MVGVGLAVVRVGGTAVVVRRLLEELDDPAGVVVARGLDAAAVGVAAAGGVVAGGVVARGLVARVALSVFGGAAAVGG